jgi:hypothetical protein
MLHLLGVLFKYLKMHGTTNPKLTFFRLGNRQKLSVD